MIRVANARAPLAQFLKIQRSGAVQPHQQPVVDWRQMDEWVYVALSVACFVIASACCVIAGFYLALWLL